MSDEELSLEVARLVGFDQYVIVKRGLYYRENAGGYTNSLAEAWKLPLAEAKKYEMYAGRADVPACEKVLIKPAPTPDYSCDLNAIAEAEKILDGNIHDGNSLRYRYSGHVYNICGREIQPFRAPARERCIAFVLTLTESNAQRGEE